MAYPMSAGLNCDWLHLGLAALLWRLLVLGLLVNSTRRILCHLKPRIIISGSAYIWCH
ncbi:hypothetical protein BDZ91DRAFT_715143 [Kalaharituber pfeilii]|nr:hypothetical protein BDZ91DRAFT_715143 [Kalaharituber pfeilii]